MHSIKISTLLKSVLFAFILVLGTSANAQEYTPENEGWLVDVHEAYEESKSTGKPILANVTGSDWCGWCKRLTKSVFIHDEFKDWTKDNVVLLELDFPKRKQIPEHIQQQNRALAQAFGVRGYPTIVVFDLEKSDTGEYSISQLGRTGYAKTVEQFTSAVDQMLAKRGSE